MATIDNRTPIQSAQSPTSFDASVPIEGVQFSPRAYTPADFYNDSWESISGAITGFGKVLSQAIDLKTQDVVGDARLKAAEADLASQNMQQTLALQKQKEDSETDVAQRIAADVELNYPADFVSQDKELGMQALRFDPDSPAAMFLRNQQATVRSRYVMDDKNEAERKARAAVEVRAVQAVGSAWSRFEQRFQSDPEFRSKVVSHQYPVEAALETMRKDLGIDITEDLDPLVTAGLGNFRDNASNLITREWNQAWAAQDLALREDVIQTVPNAHLVPIKSIVDSVDYGLSKGMHTSIPESVRMNMALETAERSIMSIDVPTLPKAENLRLRASRLEEFRRLYPSYQSEKMLAQQTGLANQLAETVASDIMATVQGPALEYGRTLAQTTGIPVDPDTALFAYMQQHDPSFISASIARKVKPDDPEQVKAAAVAVEDRLTSSAARGGRGWEERAVKQAKAADIMNKLGGDLPLNDEDLNSAYQLTNLSRAMKFQAPLDARAAGAELNNFLSRGRPPSDLVKDMGTALSSPNNAVRGQVFAVMSAMTPDNIDRLLLGMQSGQDTADLAIAARTAYLLNGSTSGNIVEVFDNTIKSVRNIGQTLREQPTTEKAFADSRDTLGGVSYDSSSWQVIRTIYAVNASNPSIADGKTPDQVLDFTLKNLGSWGLKKSVRGTVATLHKDRFNYIPPTDLSEDDVRTALIGKLNSNKEEFLSLFEQQRQQWSGIRGLDINRVDKAWLDADGNWSKEFLDSVRFEPEYEQRQLDLHPESDFGHPGATFRMFVGDRSIDTYLPDGTNILVVSDLNSPKRFKRESPISPYAGWYNEERPVESFPSFSLGQQ